MLEDSPCGRVPRTVSQPEVVDLAMMVVEPAYSRRRREFCHFDDTPLFIALETPARGTGGWFRVSDGSLAGGLDPPMCAAISARPLSRPIAWFDSPEGAWSSCLSVIHPQIGCVGGGHTQPEVVRASWSHGAHCITIRGD